MYNSLNIYSINIPQNPYLPQIFSTTQDLRNGRSPRKCKDPNVINEYSFISGYRTRKVLLNDNDNILLACKKLHNKFVANLTIGIQTREGFLRKNIVAVSFFQNCAIHQYS